MRQWVWHHGKGRFRDYNDERPHQALGYRVGILFLSCTAARRRGSSVTS